MPSIEEDNDEAQKQMMQYFKTNHIEILKTIGSGSYSKVRLAKVPEYKGTVAIKTIDKRHNGEYVKRFLPRELDIVKTLQHSNIVKVHKILDVAPFVCLVTEYCEGGDLLQKITREKRIQEPESRKLFRQMIEALSYLASLEIVHRDLKCENIFLDKVENIKLGDFGFARYLRNGEESKTFCGSRAYVAPEILRSVEYSGNTVDIWSAGIVLFVMVTGVMPFDDRNPSKMVERQLQHKIKFPKSVQLTLEVRMLIYEILHPYPPHRPTFSQMKHSKWLENTNYVIRPIPSNNSRRSRRSDGKPSNPNANNNNNNNSIIPLSTTTTKTTDQVPPP